MALVHSALGELGGSSLCYSPGWERSTVFSRRGSFPVERERQYHIYSSCQSNFSVVILQIPISITVLFLCSLIWSLGFVLASLLSKRKNENG